MQTWPHGNMSEGKRRSFFLLNNIMKQNYLISVFMGKRNVGTYFSEGLQEIASIKAVNKGCEISVYDMSKLQPLTQEQINSISSASLSSPFQESRNVQVKTTKKATSHKRKKNKRWERPIKCVETGKVFKSIKACSEYMGLSHKSIWNSINSGKPRGGYHFVNIKHNRKKFPKE